MSNLRSKPKERRVNQARRVWIPAMFGVMVACSGEIPVTPASQPQVSAQVGQEKNYSFSVTPSDRTMRVHFTRVRSEGTESISAFMQRMFASADSAGATRLVVDLRSVRGGDGFLLVPLVKGVLARERFAQHGGLLVVVGDASFSPGQSAATLLQQYANPIFVR
ncbi:MAG TPA: hypothetical protein VN876_06060 [Gemmatimonadaceae bacterium]|nr:hypothetical protein [Gemmatimonadaceae bacterium]